MFDDKYDDVLMMTLMKTVY